jgi:hypothetical protein
MSNGKIRELAWSLDIHEKIDRAEREKIGEKVQPKTIEDIMATIKTAQGGMVR